jgi:hypothetical protein
MIAWLFCQGLYPSRIIPGKRVTVVFSNEDGHTTQLLDQWAMGICLVDVRTFLSAQARARDLVKSHQLKAATVPGGAP